MSENIKNNIENTVVFSFDQKNYVVSNMPENIKEQIKILDEIRKDLAVCSYEQHKLMMALEYKKNQVYNMIQQEEAKNKEAENAKKETKPTPIKSKSKTSKKKNK